MERKEYHINMTFSERREEALKYLKNNYSLVRGYIISIVYDENEFYMEYETHYEDSSNQVIVNIKREPFKRKEGYKITAFCMNGDEKGALINLFVESDYSEDEALFMIERVYKFGLSKSKIDDIRLAHRLFANCNIPVKKNPKDIYSYLNLFESLCRIRYNIELYEDENETKYETFEVSIQKLMQYKQKDMEYIKLLLFMIFSNEERLYFVDIKNKDIFEIKNKQRKIVCKIDFSDSEDIKKMNEINFNFQ